MSTTPPFTPVFAGDHLRAAISPGDGRGELLMVTFDFRRGNRQGFSEANFSSSFARLGHAQLSITSRANDWFINDDTEALEAALAPVAARFARVHALGYSMGGYGAFRFARTLRLRHVVAVSPQATIAPGAVRGDTRYADEARSFDPVLGDLASRGDSGLGGTILVDPFLRADLAHARLIARAFPAVRIMPLPFAGHPASRVIAGAGRIWLLQRAAVRGGGRQAIRAAHREARRESAHYWTHFARTAARRHPLRSAAAEDRARACAAMAEAARQTLRAEQEENTRRNAARRAGAQVADTPG
ncbi:MAG: alpha/beta hydrolase [Rubellimicrobium sp.]|nr:alpha/beta hydrolase [Rubellimicrobium sp.]